MASVLKPVDDTRMLEKIGATLENSGEFEVSIIGYPSRGSTAHSDIKFHPLKKFNRISLKRLIIPWIILRKINQVKPELIIINTPELLLVAILNRILFGRKIVYDILENYYRNILYTHGHPRLIRPLLALAIRALEWITSPFFHHYLLAEKGYHTELRFAKPQTILQNKLPESIASKFVGRRSKGFSRLIFSGTLASSTGVFEVIRLCKQLHAIDNSYSLTLIGYCALPHELLLIKKEIADAPFISLIGGDFLVPHNEILTEISQADIGVIVYPANPSTQSSIPTKLYEYIAIQLPILIRHSEESHQLVKECGAGIILAAYPDYPSLSAEIKKLQFNPTIQPSIYWESEAKNLINCLKLL